MSSPEISILLPVRDSAAYLPEAIASLEAQTLRNWECLAIEDGSTDASPEILRGWQERDSRVRVMQGGGRGIVHALNLALAEAKTPLIARMDADDIALPERFEKQAAYMFANPDTIACGTGALMIDPVGRPICPIHPIADHNAIVEALKRGGATAIVHPTLIVRTDVLKQLDGYRETYRHVEDYDLYLRLCHIGKLANLSETLLHYRQHTASVNVSQRLRQRELRLAALNEHREGLGLPDLAELPFGRQHLNTKADLFADWSHKAAMGGNLYVSVHYAIRAIVEEYWKLARWKLIWQAFALRFARD